MRRLFLRQKSVLGAPIALVALLLPACSGSSRTDGAAGERGSGGSAGETLDGGGSGSTADGGGGSATDDGPSEAGAGGGSAGEGPDGGGGFPPDAGHVSPSELVANGTYVIAQAPRPDYGALVVVNDGLRSYVVESRRDVEPGPFGLPWRSRFRIAAYDESIEAWAYPVDPDDVISDVIVHPSGDVTFALLRYPLERMAYELVRLDRDGNQLSSTVLSEPTSLPDTDFGPADPRPLFRMKSEVADAFTGAWVRLLADGEGVVAAFLSFVDAMEQGFWSQRMAIGLATYDWQESAYVERWARVVDGRHFASPAAWAYDELRWLEQARRPFLARDDATGHLLVGRAWNTSRCEANVATFGEFTLEQCVVGAVNPVENERLPLAVTRFDSAGTRIGTRVLAPDADAAEQLAFALAARGGELGVVGSVVRKLEDGSKRTYPDANGFVDYDGYVAVYDAEGQRVKHHDFNLGRGDMLAAMRWTNDGIVAVGAAGWDRWQGGMSISRGADPVFVWLSDDGSEFATRVFPMNDDTRHWNLHDVVVLDGAVIGYGVSDAPMTHSGDGDNTAARTFGPLQIRLSAQ